MIWFKRKCGTKVRVVGELRIESRETGEGGRSEILFFVKSMIVYFNGDKKKKCLHRGDHGQSRDGGGGRRRLRRRVGRRLGGDAVHAMILREKKMKEIFKKKWRNKRVTVYCDSTKKNYNYR